MLPVAFFGICG